MATEPKVHLPLRVPQAYIERIDELAEQMGVERSEVARRALRNGIQDLEKLRTMAKNPITEKLLLLTTILESSPDEKEEITRVIRNIASNKTGRQKKK